MKRTIKFLAPVVVLLTTLFLLSGTCNHPEPPGCDCRPPHPTIAVAEDGIWITADTTGGPGAEIRLEVTSSPGGTLLHLDTITTGASVFVPVPDSIGAARVKMDYLNKSLNICPYDGIVKTFIVMEVVVELDSQNHLITDCPECGNTNIRTQNLANYQFHFIKPTSGTNINLQNIRFDNMAVSFYYLNSGPDGKVKVLVCGDAYIANEDAPNHRIILQPNGTGQRSYELLFQGASSSSAWPITICLRETVNNAAFTLSYCENDNNSETH